MTIEDALAKLVPLSIWGMPIMPKKSKHGWYTWFYHGTESFNEVAEALRGVVKFRHMIGPVSNSCRFRVHENDIGPILNRYNIKYGEYLQRTTN